eukprot:COSAG01_NODE_1037_length_11984_cov_106.566176_13_plen_91_part_00
MASMQQKEEADLCVHITYYTRVLSLLCRTSARVVQAFPCTATTTSWYSTSTSSAFLSEPMSSASTKFSTSSALNGVPPLALARLSLLYNG